MDMHKYEMKLLLNKVDNLIDSVTYLSKRIEILEEQVNKIEQTAVTHSVVQLDVHDCD